MKELHVTVQRFDPEKDKEPRFVPYTVNVNDGARVLHVLHAIHDSTRCNARIPLLLQFGAVRELCGAG